MDLLAMVRRHRVLAPLLAIALARFVYQKQRAGLEQLQLQRALSLQVSKEFNPTEDASSPVEEWIAVDDHGTQMKSLVYYPLQHDDKLLVLVVPGNPGVPYFYLPLMQELVERHGRRCEVRCLSHAGHFMPYKNDGKVFSLQQQLEHKAFYLEKRLQQDPELKLVVIGHSIGSYFVLDMAKRFPQHIQKLVLMQPTIMHMALTPKGRQIMPLFRNVERGVTLVGAVEFLVPVFMRRWIVRRVLGDVSKTLQLASQSLVNADVMHNVLHMAADEMKEVVELDNELVAQHEDKTLFVYSTVDEWVPGEFMQEYQVRFPNAQHRVVPQAHAFMMEPNGTRDMATHISQWVGEVLDGKRVRQVESTAA